MADEPSSANPTTTVDALIITAPLPRSTPSAANYKPDTRSLYERARDEAATIPLLDKGLNWTESRLGDWATDRAITAIRNGPELTPDMLAREPTAGIQDFNAKAWQPDFSLTSGSKTFDVPLGLKGTLEWNAGFSTRDEFTPQGSLKVTIPLQRILGGGRTTN